MWSVFHCITFFEKALKRSGTRKTHLSSQNNTTASSTPLHPMASHLSWMLPPLPKVRMLILKISHSKFLIPISSEYDTVMPICLCKHVHIDIMSLCC